MDLVVAATVHAGGADVHRRDAADPDDPDHLSSASEPDPSTGLAHS